MVSLFIIALAILFILGIGLYFWQKSAPADAERVLPPSPDFHGLFAQQSAKPPLATDENRPELKGSSLLTRARDGDRSSLLDAHGYGDADVYDRVLNELVARAKSNAELLSLMSYVAQHELRVNRVLANAVVDSWKESPDRSSTAKALHFAALSDDADVYRDTVEQALEFWRAGNLEIPAVELRALFDGEFWILSAHTRSSGAGFVLKRTLDSARRELENARAKQ